MLSDLCKKLIRSKCNDTFSSRNLIPAWISCVQGSENFIERTNVDIDNVYWSGTQKPVKL